MITSAASSARSPTATLCPADRLGHRATAEPRDHREQRDRKRAPGVSAFKRRRIALPDGRAELRTVRPGFRRALAMLADGRADGLIALDLDRAMRDPRPEARSRPGATWRF